MVTSLYSFFPSFLRYFGTWCALGGCLGNQQRQCAFGWVGLGLVFQPGVWKNLVACYAVHVVTYVIS